MTLLLVALGVILLGGFAAVLPGRAATLLAVGSAVIGCALALIPCVEVLLTGRTLELRLPWDVPYGEFYLKADPLAALFLVPILLISALAAIYGTEYLGKSHGAAWFFYNALVVSMACVVLAQNAILFLVAWEVMALTSFFLVTFEDEKESVRAAGWTYLVATHLGTAFLIAMFAFLGGRAGSMNFDTFGMAATFEPALRGIVFLLAVVGFGTKAGLMPFHVWLPEAHPAAPSHVSALMSGVMIKTGIYGLVRMLTLFGPPPAWWGWVLLGLGLVSGVLGVLFALAQHDLKRLLAYSSVENIGIIAMGFGIGLLGQHYGLASLAVLGFLGGLLHVVNHSLFKSLLFLGAGSVAHATGTREINRLGGLYKRMPVTAVTFLVGAVAICGLPPLNGFVGEFVVYLGAFTGTLEPWRRVVLPMLGAIAGLALIGGLAAACFLKAFGIVFLGEPRSEAASHAHEARRPMILPLIVLAGACLVVGLLSFAAIPFMGPVAAQVSGLGDRVVEREIARATRPLLCVSIAGLGFIALLATIAWFRRVLLSGRSVSQTVTWDCGYAKPTARMQYTEASFVQPFTELCAPVLQTRERVGRPEGYFPKQASFESETPDVCREEAYRPVFGASALVLSKLRWLQHGRVQLYVLYIALTLLALMIWKLG